MQRMLFLKLYYNYTEIYYSYNSHMSAYVFACLKNFIKKGRVEI
jgi:hypothetical protein